MDLNGMVKTTETEFLKIIIVHLKSGKMKLAQAKEITKEFLALLPFANYENFRQKIQDFTNKYEDFKSLFIMILKIEEDAKVNDVLTKMRGYLKENKVDEALNLVK